MKTIIILTPDEAAFADEVGIKRFEWARAHRYDSGAGTTNYPPSREKDMLGARHEAAAYKWAKPAVWHMFVTDGQTRALADIEDFIDVKGVERNNDRLVVQSGKGHPDWAYIHSTHIPAGGEFGPTAYWLRGWLWGREVMQDQYLFTPTNGWEGYFYPNERAFRPMDALLTVLRCRQAGADDPDQPSLAAVSRQMQVEKYKTLFAGAGGEQGSRTSEA